MQINEIAIALMSKKAAVLPTDTVWGIVSKHEDLIYTIKQRPIEKKVSKFVSSLNDIGMPSFFVKTLERYVPGALSIIWKNISYRIPNCQYLIKLLHLTGPLYQSSANISGQEPITSINEAKGKFKKWKDKIVFVENDPPENISFRPSTIINLDNLTVIRSGSINGEKIIKKLAKGQ